MRVAGALAIQTQLLTSIGRSSPCSALQRAEALPAFVAGQSGSLRPYVDCNHPQDRATAF